MHADLEKLIELQTRDALVAGAEARLSALSAETSGLDQVLQAAKAKLEVARRAAADGQRRRDDLETKIESYRILQDRRRQRLEQVRNPKDASTLMTELDLAQSVMAKEENDWLRSAEMVMQLEVKVKDEERNLAAIEQAQAPASLECCGRAAGGGCGGCLPHRHSNESEKPDQGGYRDRCLRGLWSDSVPDRAGGVGLMSRQRG